MASMYDKTTGRLTAMSRPTLRNGLLFDSRLIRS